MRGARGWTAPLHGSRWLPPIDGPNASTDLFLTVEASDVATCGVRVDGRAVCWGGGDLSGPNSSLDTYVSVVPGDDHTCALRTDGRLVCWGNDSYGQVSGPNASTRRFGLLQGTPVLCDDHNSCTDDSCNFASGCVYASNTQVCDDGNPSTLGDVCTAGVCVGVDRCAGVTCTALDQCHSAGVCDSATGHCSNPAKVNGSSRSDGSACTLTDTCQAGVCSGGNYSWSGFLEPINQDGSSIFKQGSTIPVKFRLTGGCAGITSLMARILLAKISNSIVGTEVEAVSTSAADTGNLFRYAGSDQYIFNLSTRTLSDGTWRIRVNMGDGANHIVNVSLRK